MAKYTVPIFITISGHIDVEADSKEEARELAKREYWRRYDEEGGRFAVDLPSVDIDWGDDDDIEEETDGDEDS